MDKRIILAKAGSGKTTEIINRLNTNDKILIITYTNNNYDNLKKNIIRKYNEIPSNIKVFTYFSFLYKICFAPLKKGWDVRGLDFNKNNKYVSSQKINYYLNIKNRKMYHYRLAKFCNEKMLNIIKERLEKNFDYIYIDEVQDFSGHDFNFLLNILKFNINYLLVGDFYQHTYDTSQDGNVNKNLYNDYNKYLKRFSDSKIIIDTSSLIKSKRCSKNVCNFIKNEINIDIESEKNDETIVKELTIYEDIEKVIVDDSIIKLFYENCNKYDINNTDNWGNSKGKTYNDVCVILNNKTYELFKKNELMKLPPKTKNKLYVACSRPLGNIFFIQESKIQKYKIIKKKNKSTINI